MSSTVIKCCLCGLRKPLAEYSKNARKQDDPACVRCVAWTETQEPGVVPAPLETGHVSLEEFGANYWGDEFRTDDDFFANEMVPQPPDRHPGSSWSQRRNPNPPPATTTTAISRSTGYPTLPSHLRDKVKYDPAPSEAASSTSPPRTTRSSSSQLPPHLRPRDSSLSISTATTVRNDHLSRREEKRVEYNAFGPDGEMQVRSKTPTTAPSTTGTPSAASEGPERAGHWPTRLPRQPRPHRQIDVNPVPHYPIKRANCGSGSTRSLGFCNSDDDSD